MGTRKYAQLFAMMLTAISTSAASAATCPANYPDKPIRFVISLGAGGGTDLIGRTIASAIEEQQKWTAVIENRPGAGGGVMAVWLKTQPTDGYTIGVITNDALVINPAQQDVGYTWEDFDYLGSAMQSWNVMVALANKPFNTLTELIEYARKNGRATVNAAGVMQELLIKQLAEQYKVNLVAIPGTGAADGMTLALGGHVDATIQGALHIPHIKSGNMKQLASLVERRMPYAPNSATMAEQGATAAPLDLHIMLLAPKGLPAPVKECLKGVIDEATKSASYKALMVKFENEPLNLGEDGLRTMLGRMATFYKTTLAKK